MTPPGLALDSDGEDDHTAPTESFMLSQSGTFKVEDFNISRSGLMPVGERKASPEGPAATIDVKSMNELDTLNELGSGASGTVYRARHKVTGEVFAVKQVTILDKPKRDQVVSELRIMMSHTHGPWLVSLYNAFYEEAKVYTVLEFMDAGSIEALVLKHKDVGLRDERELAKIALQILNGLQYLHRQLHQVGTHGLSSPPTLAHLPPQPHRHCNPAHPPRPLARSASLAHHSLHTLTLSGASRPQAGQRAAQQRGPGQDFRLWHLFAARVDSRTLLHFCAASKPDPPQRLIPCPCPRPRPLLGHPAETNANALPDSECIAAGGDHVLHVSGAAIWRTVLVRRRHLVIWDDHARAGQGGVPVPAGGLVLQSALKYHGELERAPHITRAGPVLIRVIA